jgi:hypothetical protein
MNILMTFNEIKVKINFSPRFILAKESFKRAKNK